MNLSRLTINSFLLLALASSNAWAEQSPKALMEETESAQNSPAISVSDAKTVDASQIGLLSPTEAGLPDALWKDLSATEYTSLLRGIARGIPAASLRNLATRALVTSTVLPDSKSDLLTERVDVLLRLGQANFAQKLLAELPQSYRKPRHQELQFLFKVIEGKDDKSLCKEASDHLDTKASPLWQRWVVLCQAKAGEKDKAQLGLDLLSEQNQYSEFYQKIVQNLLSKEAVTKLPEVVYLEQAAWLIFSGQSDYLQKQSQPPLALASLLLKKGTLPQKWQKTATRYGLPAASLKVPEDTSFTPDLAHLQLPEKNSTDADRRIAFLAFGLRKALDKPISLEVEESLSSAYYRAGQVIASPAWHHRLSQAAKSGKSGEVVLLLGGLFHSPLNEYAPADIATAVKALVDCGLTADASALAQEAMGAALASRK